MIEQCEKCARYNSLGCPYDYDLAVKLSECDEFKPKYPRVRNLDGVYFRVERDGKFENVCFSDLTSEEREKILADKPTEWLKQMCRLLADSLRKIGDFTDIEFR